jgi:hypothetical protein
MLVSIPRKIYWRRGRRSALNFDTEDITSQSLL